jgi:hypothetical protein
VTDEVLDASPATTEASVAVATQPKKRTRSTASRSSSTTRKRSRSKTPTESVPEEVKSEADTARERVHDVLTQAEGLKEEASQVREQILGTASEVNEQAGEALHEVREARQEADLVRYEVGQVRQQVEQVRQEATQVRSDLDSVRLEAIKARQDMDRSVPDVAPLRDQTAQAQHDLEQIRQQADEARRQLEAIQAELAETQESLRNVRQECQSASQSHEEELRQELERSRQRSQDLQQEIEQASHAARTRLEQAHGQLEEVCRTRPAPPVPPLPSHALTTEAEVNGTEEADVIQASVRPETPQERLLHHLSQAWAVKEAVADALRDMIGEVVDPNLRSALEEQQRLTEKHKHELDDRLRALGGEPVSSKGILQRLAGWVGEPRKREADDYDRALQDLEKALTVQQSEVTIAGVLEVLATGAADAETAALAQRQRAEKQSAVERLQQLIVPVSELAVRLPASAREAAQQLLVEAGVTELPPEMPKEEGVRA